MSVQNKSAAIAGVAPNAGEMAEPKRPRGRPRAYDKRQALQQSLRAFWAGGYAGTSLDDLSAATGMNRPSLYAAFGDKRALYLALVERYAQGGQQAMRAALAPDVPLPEGLLAVFDTALDMYFPAGGPPQGCFLVGTGVAAAGTDDAVRAQVGQAFKAFDHEFELRFQLAQQRGELAPGAEPAMLARLASALLHTLAMRSRVGDARAELRATAQAGVALLCGTAPQPRVGKTARA